MFKLLKKGKITTSDFLSSNIQISIWKNNGKIRTNQIELLLVGEVNYFVQQLFFGQNIQNSKKPGYKRIKIKNSVLRLYDSIIGNVSVFCELKHDCFIMQNCIGVTSEKGIIPFDSEFKFISKKSSNLHVIYLKTRTSELLNFFTSQDLNQQNLNWSELKTHFKNLSSVLLNNKSELIYPKQNDLVEVQYILIELCNFFVQIYDKIDKSCESDFFDCFLMLISREEFSLG